MGDLFDEPDTATPLTAEETRELVPAHIAMFGDVWRWAGKLRTSERYLGIAHHEIPGALRQLLDDARAWIEYKTYPPDEIAVQFHHRLVQIHPFPNGNGRHARLMGDLLVMRLGGGRFLWGSAIGCQPHMSLHSGARLGPYAVTAPLGAGGMGEV